MWKPLFPSPSPSRRSSSVVTLHRHLSMLRGGKEPRQEGEEGGWASVFMFWRRTPPHAHKYHYAAPQPPRGTHSKGTERLVFEQPTVYSPCVTKPSLHSYLLRTSHVWFHASLPLQHAYTHTSTAHNVFKYAGIHTDGKTNMLRAYACKDPGLNNSTFPVPESWEMTATVDQLGFVNTSSFGTTGMSERAHECQSEVV